MSKNNPEELYYKNLSLEDIPGEEWRSVIDWDGFYEISSMGRVKSVERVLIREDGRTFKIKPRILRQALSKNKNHLQYLKVVFSRNHDQHSYEVHRLQGLTFLDPVPGKDFILHIDHNTLRNLSSNIKYGTRSEKGVQTYTLGNGVKTNEGKFGGDSPSSKSVKMFDLSGNLIRNFDSRIEAAQYLIDKKIVRKQPLQNIMSNINHNIIGRAKSAYGYIWVNPMIKNY